LVGRADEVRAIESLVAAAADGQRRVLLLEGEAGIGKSSLLDHALSVGTAAGMLTLRGRAEELESRRPFGAIASCLGVTAATSDRRRREVGDLLYGHVAGGVGDVLAPHSSDGESRLVEAMVGLVEDLASGGGVVLAVDDLHWADPYTLQVLHRLGRSTVDAPLLVCGAFRSAPRPPELARLVEGLTARGAATVRVPSLEPAQVAELLGVVLGQAPGPRLVRQAASAGGNPFYVTELVRALRASGSVTSSETSAEIGTVAMPPALKLTVLLEISFLSKGVQELLRTASVLGSAFSAADLATVVGRAPAAVTAELGEAMLAGVLREEGERITFRHDVVREALYDDIPLSLRMSVHLHAARALAAAGASSVQVAEHFVRGATRGDAEALQWLTRAADEATVRAPAMAAGLLERALALFEPGDPRRDLMVADWVFCLEISGRWRGVGAICRDALSRPQEPLTRARLHLTLARMGTDLDQTMAQTALAQEVVGLSPTQRARVVATSSALFIYRDGLDLAEATARSGLRRGQECDDGLAQAISCLTLAGVAFNRARFVDSVDWASRATVTRDATPDARVGHGWRNFVEVSRVQLSQALLRVDRVEESMDVLTGARETMTEVGRRSQLAVAQTLHVSHNFFLGQWDDAVTEFDALVDLSVEMGSRPLTYRIAAGARALIAVHRGMPAAGWEALAEVPNDVPQLGHLAALARALLTEVAGDQAAALAELSRSWDTVTASGFRVAALTFAPDMVRLARAQGDDTRAATACELAEDVAGANPGVASLHGIARRCRGMLEDDVGALVEAATALRASPRPLETALACEDAAAALGRAGDVAAARPWFDEAMRIYGEVDATWDASRASARMRGLGLRRPVGEYRRRPRSGWDALTRGERAVVELVAEGLSNPEVAERLFLSRHTVKRHLANAMVKLGLASRVELVRAGVAG
jgi:DNA-binding CsgD family transcriptional regulator